MESGELGYVASITISPSIGSWFLIDNGIPY